MRVSFTVVNARNKRAGRAEAIANFTGVQRQDLVLDFPAMPLQTAGDYFVAVDIDGKLAKKLPLFKVKVEGAAPPAAAGDASGVGGADDEL
jgi:hypothetical protein